MTLKHALAGIVAASAALIGLGSLATRPAQADPTETFLIACETALVEALVSPSSYRRLSATGPTLEPLTLDWYLSRTPSIEAHRRGDDRQRDLAIALTEIGERQVAAGHQVATTVIRYEAANRLGVALAGRALCETVTPPEGLPDDPRDLTEIWIDGRDSIGRLFP